MNIGKSLSILSKEFIEFVATITFPSDFFIESVITSLISKKSSVAASSLGYSSPSQDTGPTG